MQSFGATRIAAEQPALGIDIGSQVVKYILADQVADRIDILAAGSFGLDEGIVQGGVVKEPKIFGKILSSQLASHRIASASVVLSIPSNLATLRWVNLPPLPPDELRLAARFKVKRHLPFPVEEAYVEASPPVQEEGETGGQSLVIAVRREVIDSRAEAIEQAGLTPIAAELEAQAILRVVERRLSEQSALWRDASLTIIDVGATNTHMYVVQNQCLQFIRGVKFGADPIARAVAAALDVPLDQAEALMGLHDTALSPEGVLRMTYQDAIVIVNVENELEKLTREFLRLLRYFRSLHPERSYAGILDHILVCGGLAGLQGFDKYLENSLRLRVERCRPFAGILGNFSKETFTNIANRQEAFTVVMGLALCGLKGKDQTKGRISFERREFAWARTA